MGDRAALGATGLVAATAMGSLAPETAFAAASQFPEPGQPDPNFAEGLITQAVPLNSTIEVNGKPFEIEGVTTR